jgi:large subunit ribosomal protein L13
LHNKKENTTFTVYLSKVHVFYYVIIFFKTDSVDHISYKTKSVNRENAQKEWVLIDAETQILGRLASQVAAMIKGKHKPSFTPHVDCGDNVVVINADKIRLTGAKWDKKQYISYTGYPGGQKTTTPRQLKEKFPTRIIEHAVKGMLPKNKLGRRLFHNLFVYAGPEHEHEAQKPKNITLKD